MIVFYANVFFKRAGDNPGKAKLINWHRWPHDGKVSIVLIPNKLPLNPVTKSRREQFLQNLLMIVRWYRIF